MANQLKVATVHSILTLRDRGWSQRRIQLSETGEPEVLITSAAETSCAPSASPSRILRAAVERCTSGEKLEGATTFESL
jgi:hypothetical protein